MRPSSGLKEKKNNLIRPTEREIKENPPSRSAKLRYAIKKEDFYEFETDILDKFKYLIDIENFDVKKQTSQVLVCDR